MRALALFLFFTLATSALAEDELDDLLGANDALRGSQEALTNPAKRADRASDPKASAAMQALEKLAGSPENAQRIYALAAEVMGNLVKSAGGDVEKIMKLLESGLKNPGAFADKLTPEQKTKLHDVATAIEKGKLP